MLKKDRGCVNKEKTDPIINTDNYTRMKIKLKTNI